MPTFHLTDQSGAEYEVDAPDAGSAVAALSHPAVGSTAQKGDAGANAAFGQGFLEGVPIVGPAIAGAADRVGAGLASLITGGSYADELAKGQKLAKDTAESHPIASTVGNLTGGVMATAPVVAAAPGLFGAGPGPLTVGKVLAGGGTGAVIGGADAAVRTGGDPTAVAVGTGLGGVLGGAAPAAGALIGRGAQAGADYLAQRGALNGMGISRPAADIITRAAEADGALNGQGLANIRAAGPNAMLADAGPGVQNVLDTAIQRGGPQSAAARAAVDARAGDQSTLLEAALDRTLGTPQGVQTATNDIRNSTASARSAAYDAAYNAPIDYSSKEGMAIESLVKNHVPGKAIAQANALIRADPEAGPSRQILAHIADDGSVTYERLPDVRQLDYITRGLNDVADAENGTGKLGGQTALGRTYGNLSQAIRGQLKRAVPEYSHALDTAAQPIQARNALEFGSEMLRPSMPRDVVAEQIGGMTQPEVRAARQGLRSQIADAFANVQRTITDPNVDARQAMALVKQFSSDAAQEKIGMLINRNEMQGLRQALDRASRALELRGAMATNSKTAARLITKEGVDQATELGPIGKLAQGEPLKAGKSVIQYLTETRPSDMTRRQDAIYGELASTLTGRRGQDAVDFLQRLQDAYHTRAGVNSIARQIPYGAIAGTGFLSTLPAINQRMK